MSTRRKQGRPDSIMAWLMADPWRKLGAIVLALVSWEYLDKRVNDEHESHLEVILPGQPKGTDNYLRLDIDPQEYTLTREDVLDAANDQQLPEDGIEILIKGEKATIDRMKGTLELVYRPTIAQMSEAANTGSLTFGVKDLLHEKAALAPDLENLNSMKITPARIRLRIRRNTTKNLSLAEEHVSLDYGVSGLEERLSNPKFSHTSVDLRGPQQAIQNLPQRGPIFQGKVGVVMRDATTVRIELELLPRLKGIVTNQSIYVTYTVEPDWQPFAFRNVPIDIDNRLLPEAQQRSNPFRVEPERLEEVRLKVKGDLANMLNRIKSNPQEVADFQRKHLRLVVYPLPEYVKQPRWPVLPDVEFVRFDDIPTPRKDIDFKVDTDQVNIIKK